ncbi:hypothetical protein LOTGIDRAFT_205233 [Lottia gigantea]|uniref:L antigen family member 3 n=1 Tax=Lottia gigantea TaxID=225164 RepID=V4A782_LOTGI|nr:hypothetical protein LOTGIDRAFT_205233 [Lottia gigantea]ESO99803.1 hypothetical protein LOTGIDRAFT_205233 [Lottia gigantea]
MGCNDVNKVDLNVPFSSKREAEIAYGTLSVDKEPKRGGVKRVVSVDDRFLKVHFEAEEVRSLRVSINSFMDYLLLVIQTIEKFGPQS